MPAIVVVDEIPVTAAGAVDAAALRPHTHGGQQAARTHGGQQAAMRAS